MYAPGEARVTSELLAKICAGGLEDGAKKYDFRSRSDSEKCPFSQSPAGDNGHVWPLRLMLDHDDPSYFSILEELANRFWLNAGRLLGLGSWTVVGDPAVLTAIYAIARGRATMQLDQSLKHLLETCVPDGILEPEKCFSVSFAPGFNQPIRAGRVKAEDCIDHDD